VVSGSEDARATLWEVSIIRSKRSSSTSSSGSSNTSRIDMITSSPRTARLSSPDQRMRAPRFGRSVVVVV